MSGFERSIVKAPNHEDFKQWFIEYDQKAWLITAGCVFDIPSYFLSYKKHLTQVDQEPFLLVQFEVNHGGYMLENYPFTKVYIEIRFNFLKRKKTARQEEVGRKHSFWISGLTKTIKAV